MEAHRWVLMGPVTCRASELISATQGFWDMGSPGSAEQPSGQTVLGKEGNLPSWKCFLGLVMTLRLGMSLVCLM